ARRIDRSTAGHRLAGRRGVDQQVDERGDRVFEGRPPRPRLLRHGRERMNIAFLLPDPSISGRSRTVAEQAEALAARGHRVRIIGEDDPAPAEDEVVIDEPPPIVIVNPNFYRHKIPHDNTPLRVLLAGVSPEDGYGAA